jgi:hypothetical protein
MTRDQLPDPTRRILDAVRQVEPPDDLLHTVMAEAEATPQERGLRFSWLPAAGWGMAAVVVVALAVIAVPRLAQLGQSPSPAGSGGPSAGATPIHVTPVEIGQLPIAGAIESQTTTPPGAYPGSADATSVWLGSESTGEVLRFDVASGEITGSVQVNEPTSEPYDLWPISDGTSVWTAGRDDRSLVRIDIASMQVADRWAIVAVPYRVAPAGSVVWVTDFEGGRVLRVDASTGEVELSVDVSRPTGVAVTSDAVWVATYSGAVVRLDPSTGTRVASYSIAHNATDVYPVGDQLWIVGINGRRLERLDTATGLVAAWTDEVTAISFLDGRPWAAVSGGALVELHPITLERIGAVRLGDVTTDQMVATGGRLWAFGATADETFLYGVRPSGS